MRRADTSGVLPQEQHGYRPGNTLIDVVMIISFFFQYVIQTIRKYMRIYFYADNCYDCVEHMVYSLTDDSSDSKWSEIILYLKTIQEMNFYPINSLVLNLGLESRY